MQGWSDLSFISTKKKLQHQRVMDELNETGGQGMADVFIHGLGFWYR